ncbi:MAG: hypothetical protein K0V04_41125 [Deltaproteobacteria bacterium]|nr:hypothetical protein [Deltaproteobacteria bacterium]
MRDTLQGWASSEPVTVGQCRFTLGDVRLWHSNAWNMEADVYIDNTGIEEARCSLSLQTMTEASTALTDAADASRALAPDEQWEQTIVAREASVTGLSGGAAQGAWVYAKLGQGRWPMADTTGVHVSPERVRPPRDPAE